MVMADMGGIERTGVLAFAAVIGRVLRGAELVMHRLVVRQRGLADMHAAPQHGHDQKQAEKTKHGGALAGVSVRVNC